VFGCLFNAWTCERFSRKYSMMLGSVILIIGGAFCGGAYDIAMFLVGRFIAGWGAGMLACVVPMYQAEISTPQTRGAMVCTTGVAYALGYTLAGWMGFACYFLPADSPHAQFAWRFPLLFQCVFPIMVLMGWKFIPFSRTPGDPENIKAREELLLMEKQFELDKSMDVRWYEIFRTAPNRRRAIVGMVMMTGHQFLGSFVLANYGVLIYASLGLTGFVPLLLNACWTSFTIIGNIWTAFFVDRFGRRTFILIGSIGCTTSVICLCALTAQYLNTDNVAGLRAAVFFVFFFIFWWCFFLDA
jgi:MFS family permease